MKGAVTLAGLGGGGYLSQCREVRASLNQEVEGAEPSREEEVRDLPDLRQHKRRWKACIANPEQVVARQKYQRMT